jgi:hypothetical protein
MNESASGVIRIGTAVAECPGEARVIKANKLTLKFIGRRGHRT